MATPTHPPGPVFEIRSVGFNLEGRTIITHRTHTPLAHVFSPGQAELLTTYLAVALDVALMRNHKLMDYNLFIHITFVYKFLSIMLGIIIANRCIQNRK